MANNSSIDTSCFPTSHQLEIIGWVSIGTGGASLISCILILFVAILFQKYRGTTQRVILYLTITVFLNSILYSLHGIRTILEGATDSYFCTSLAFLDQVINWMEFLAILCLTIDFFVKSVFLKFHTERYEIVYALAIFILPFTFNWVPFLGNTYGYGGTNCWIKQYKDMNCSETDVLGLAFRFGLYWVPFYIIMTFVIIAYFVSLIKARRRITQYSATSPTFSEQTIKELLLSEVRQYQLYPFIMIVIFSLGIVSRIAEAVDDGKNFFALRVFHVIVMAIQGPVIAIVFTMDYDTRKQICNPRQIRTACFGLWCCCRKTRVREYTAIIHEGSFTSDPVMTPKQSCSFEEESLATGSGNLVTSKKNDVI